MACAVSSLDVAHAFLSNAEALGGNMFAEIERVRSMQLSDYAEVFRVVCHERRVERLIADALGKYLGGVAAPLSGMHANEVQIILYRDDYVVIETRYLPPFRPRIHPDATEIEPITLLTCDMLITALGHGTADIALYEAEGIVDPAIFDRSARLRIGDIATLQAGSFVELKANQHAFQMHSTDTGVAVLQISSRRCSPLSWRFDNTSGSAVGSAAPNVDAWRQESSIAALRHLGDKDAIPDIEAIARNSPYHFARMAALRNLLLMDFDKGLILMCEASEHDPHPHVRAAAMKTAQNIQAAVQTGRS
jgi:hypothetical protein